MNTQITTVIPTYRRPRLLDRAIRSVIAQNYPNSEIHVFDNASGDNTREVVARLAEKDSRVKYHRHPRNIGMMENFAHGISKVSTPFFSILSDDDFILPGFYDTAMRSLEEYPEAGFFLGGLLFADPAVQVVHASNVGRAMRGLIRQPDLFISLLPGAWLTWTSTVFRTERVKQAGGLNVAFGHTGDVDLVLRLAATYPAFLDPRPCAVFSMHPDSASGRDRFDVLRQQLTLKEYANIENAVALALRLGMLSDRDAGLMRGTLRSTSAWSIFRRALIFSSQGEIDLARQTSNVLISGFGRCDLALILRLLASRGISGNFARRAVESARTIRAVGRDWCGTDRNTGHTHLIRSVLRTLENDTGKQPRH
ncbi:MAG: glycosyltransferase family A protein [Candidatus Binataceae bacterium]|jgi:GT2 family glycosyltransferase